MRCGARGLRAGRLAGREPAQVAVRAHRPLGPLHAPSGDRARGLQPRPRLPAHARGRGGPEPDGLRGEPGPAIPRAEALDGAARVRHRGDRRAHPRSTSAWPRPCARGSRPIRGSRSWPRRGSRSSASGPDSPAALPEDEDALNEAVVEAVNATGEAFLAPTKLRGRTTIRLAIGNIRTEERHVRRAFDLLREAAAARRGSRRARRKIAWRGAMTVLSVLETDPRHPARRQRGREREKQRRAGGLGQEHTALDAVQPPRAAPARSLVPSSAATSPRGSSPRNKTASRT